MEYGGLGACPQKKKLKYTIIFIFGLFRTKYRRTLQAFATVYFAYSPYYYYYEIVHEVHNKPWLSLGLFRLAPRKKM